MSRTYSMSESWWLRVKRAQLHMVEIECAIRDYSDSHPYEIVRTPPPKRQQDLWRYVVRITKQPDPMIAVVIGEFVHTLRSALDNVVVACAPPQRRHRASFPIEFHDIWAKNRAGVYVVPDDGRRERYLTAIEGLPVEAKTFIEISQPYQVGQLHSLAGLGLLSRLENADKHRGLITVGTGLVHVQTSVTIRGEILQRPLTYERVDMRLDGTEVATFVWNSANQPTESEVQVEVSGTAAIAIEVSNLDGKQPPLHFGTRVTMLSALRLVRHVLRNLEEFASP